jgi:hypothetical protein
LALYRQGDGAGVLQKAEGIQVPSNKVDRLECTGEGVAEENAFKLASGNRAKHHIAANDELSSEIEQLVDTVVQVRDKSVEFG